MLRGSQWGLRLPPRPACRVSAADPEPSSTTTSPATTDAQRLELERRIGLLDLEIGDLNLKGGRDSIALEIDIITRSRTALVEERRACNVFDMAEIFPLDRRIGFLDLHLESLRLKDLMIQKERADETTRSIDALSRSRTVLVTELRALSLFDFIDRSGPAIPGSSTWSSPLTLTGFRSLATISYNASLGAMAPAAGRFIFIVGLS